MQKHTKIYLDAFGYTTADWIGCETCNKTAVDINHIIARGMGGSKGKDRIENLMASCRKCHNEYGDIKSVREMLFKIHYAILDKNNIKYDIGWNQ